MATTGAVARNGLAMVAPSSTDIRGDELASVLGDDEGAGEGGSR